MLNIEAESAPKTKPLTRKRMHHQRTVLHLKPDGNRQVGLLVSRPAAGDEFARWLITPMAPFGVCWQRVTWDSVDAGEWFAAGPEDLTAAEQRTLAQYLRGYLHRD